MNLKKSMLKVLCKLSFVFAAVFLISGCTSISYIQGLIDRGDKVTAIERLCARISKDSGDEEAVTLFISIYPTTAEELYPSKDVARVRREFASKYGVSEIDAIKRCLSQISKRSNILYHQDIAGVINESNSIISAYEKLIRIQNAVRSIPNTISNASVKNYQVKKYDDNFKGMINTANKELGEFYFNIAEAMYPGNDIDERKVIISIYKKSSSYSFDTSRIADKLQGLNYEIAIELINQKFKDDQFLTEKEYQEIIGYLEDAGNYKDAKQKIITVKYCLALLYRSENNRKSYEEAGKLFEELGNFMNSYNEAQLYGFYKRIEMIGGSAASGNISLKPGSYNSFKIDKNFINYENGSTKIIVNNSTSAIDIYSNDYRTVIYPGSVITGESIASQDYTKFKYGSRNQLTYGFYLSGKQVTEGLLVNPFDGSLCEKEIQKNVSKYAMYIEPEYSYEFYELNSPEDLKAATAIGAGRKKVAYANENSRWYSNKSYTLVKVTQKYYTTSLNNLNLPINLFAADKNVVNLNTVKSVSPYYVSSVDYGRKAYFVISSDLTNDEIINDIKTARPRDGKNSGATGLRVNSEIERKWSRNNTLVSAITVCDKYYAINDIAGIYNWIKVGTDMAVEVNEIVPISFTLRSVYDNSYAVLSQSVEVPFVAQIKPVKVEEQKPSPAPKAKPVAPSTPAPKAEPAAPAVPVPAPVVTPANEQPADNNHTASQPAASNSIIFVGKHGTYSVSSISVESGSGVKTWIYNIPANDIENCTASWNTAEFKSVSINGIQMTMNSTVYSFRDVCGNTISLDTVDANGNRVHHLLLVKKN